MATHPSSLPAGSSAAMKKEAWRRGRVIVLPPSQAVLQLFLRAAGPSLPPVAHACSPPTNQKICSKD